MNWKERLFQIFVSQKFIMFAVALAYIWLALPDESRSSPTITAITVFGGMKMMDYARSAVVSRAETMMNGRIQSDATRPDYQGNLGGD